MLLSQSVMASPLVSERYARSQALGGRRRNAVAPAASDVFATPETGRQWDFRARLLIAMAASGAASTPLARAQAYPVFPKPGVTRSTRAEGDEQVVTETVTERVQVMHIDVGGRPSPWSDRTGEATDAIGTISAEWTDSVDAGRVRPHMTYLYLSAAAAYMRAEQAKTWVYS